jgi:chromosome segregation ATPase
MPHIKEIRVVNVHFNNATQFYDDFKMMFEGKNATYDLENGGGKSLLLLMLLQTVLPKSYLRKEKPVSLLFQGGKDRTSHVAVEWILEEGSQYKYLLTGFSARKSKNAGSGATREAAEEDEKISASDIDYINWCIFYNDRRITDIESAPLCTEEAGRKTYAGFDDIRRYIQQVKQKGLPAEVFDRIDKYQSFISAHQLISAEWNIIKGINSGENSIEAYFRQHPTSRKLIENQFIKIIEDVEALNKGEKNSDESLLLADTLIEIRNRLSEYLKLKGHISEFEKIKEYYADFQNRNNELLDNFMKFEDCKNQAIGIRKLIKQKLEFLQNTENEILKKSEENRVSCSEGTILKKLLQAGLVQYEINGLEHSKCILLEEQRTLRNGYEELDKKYNEIMSLEGYGDFRKIKSRLLEAEKSLSVLERDMGNVNEEYRTAGGKLKYLVNHNLKKDKDAEEQLRYLIATADSEKRNKNIELISQERNEASLQTEINSLDKKYTELNEVLKILQNNFMRNGEMEALLDTQKFIEKTALQKKEYESQYIIREERIKYIDSRLQTLELTIENITGKINLKEQSKNSCDEWLLQYQRELENLEQRAYGFDNNTLEGYKDELELQIEREGLGKLEHEIESARLRQKKQLSEKRGFYVPNEELIAFAESLSTKCEFVKLGVDWIAECSENKAAIIKELPFLPFSIIVDGKSYEKLVSGRIKPDINTDYPIPLVNVDVVRNSSHLSREQIFYVCSFTELLLSNDKFKQYIQGIDERLNVLNIETGNAEMRLKGLNTDLHTLMLFMREYPNNKVEETIKKAETLKADISELNEKQISTEKEKTELIEEREVVGEKLIQLQAAVSSAAEKLEKLEKLIRNQQEQEDISKELKEKKTTIENIKDVIIMIKIDNAKLDTVIGQYEDELMQLGIKIHDMQKESSLLESFSERENNEAVEEIRSQYNALDAAMGGRLDDEKRLRNDIKDYTERMQILKTRIYRDYKTDLDGIWDKENNGVVIFIPTQKTIQKAKSEKENAEYRLKEIQKGMAVLDVKISKAEGKKGEILKDIPETETKQLPIYESEQYYHKEIKFTGELIESYELENKELQVKLKSIGSETSKLDAQAEYYDSFIRREEVTADGCISADIKDFRIFEEEYLNLKNIIKVQLDKWIDRVKAIQQETAAYIIREPLEELAKIIRPDTAAQCRMRKQAFSEYINNIEQQMQKISNDILQLESYQQDFTRRCIQRAELVLGHLKKMESLSRIDVNGRRINMLELRLNEFEEKEKNMRMKNHIDGIVREISEDGTIDRKRVSIKLSTKELLAQIADMDKAVVKLYKIESVPENSRFYRWENAIGSEGQNNSLYFIFAACLISFIRMLSITNTSLKTKKVIIVDNPFGATSAVYLWKPMFEIMKQNNIQLIAPGHRIPREITSQFGVSYLLNQDILQDGRMRVVVKDVRVEEDEEVMKYINHEQLSLF